MTDDAQETEHPSEPGSPRRTPLGAIRIPANAIREELDAIVDRLYEEMRAALPPRPEKDDPQE